MNARERRANPAFTKLSNSSARNCSKQRLSKPFRPASRIRWRDIIFPTMPAGIEEKLRRAKILVTMGPALENVSVLAQVLLAGADAFRINFSHGDQEQHARYVSLIRATAARMGRPCALLADLMGPKVRVDAREYELRPGHEVVVAPKPGHPE